MKRFKVQARKSVTPRRMFNEEDYSEPSLLITSPRILKTIDYEISGFGKYFPQSSVFFFFLFKLVLIKLVELAVKELLESLLG